jgi:hypothetical protein
MIGTDIQLKNGGLSVIAERLMTQFKVKSAHLRTAINEHSSSYEGDWHD